MFVLLRLISGETVIGRTEGDIYKLKQPMSIFLQPTPDGRIGIAFQSFIVGAEQNTTIKVNKDHVTAIVREPDINKELVKEYVKITSGLVIESKPIIKPGKA